MMRERDKALYKFKSSKSDIDWNRYKELRNFTLSSIRSEKKAYLNHVIKQKESRKLWTALSNLNIRSCKNISLPTNLSNPNNINDYFAPFLQHASKCDELIDFYETNFLNPSKSFSFSMCTVDEVIQIVNELKSNAYGCDNISPVMINYCSPFICQYIVHIINSCIERSYFPLKWKIAIGKPLPKNTNPSSFSDLRIISILPVLSKNFERILYKQIYDYFDKNALLPSSQCGFRTGFSTSTALATVVNDILHAYDKGLTTMLVLLDFSKAFDTINHNLLLSKLKYYGFSYNSLKLVRSYLRDRFQFITVGNESSNNVSISSGVPQGSILGPLFFIIYTTDILKSVSNNCYIQAYADDTQIYMHFHANDYNLTAAVMNTELSNIKIISEEHVLKLNSDKCKLLLFGNEKVTSSLKNHLNININGDPLSFTDSARNLGLIIDTNLRFEDHVKKTLQKAYSSLKLIYENRKILNTSLRTMLCDSLVLSHFNCNDFIYGPCLTAVNSHRIQKVQNACCRVIYGLRKFDHISENFRDTKWLNMANRRLHHLGNFVHRLVADNSSLPLFVSNLVSRSSVHPRNIRFKNKFTMPHHRTAMFQRSFTFNSISLYNSLPDEFKKFNINKFKYKYKQFLLSRQCKE